MNYDENSINFIESIIILIILVFMVMFINDDQSVLGRLAFILAIFIAFLIYMEGKNARIRQRRTHKNTKTNIHNANDRTNDDNNGTHNHNMDWNDPMGITNTSNNRNIHPKNTKRAEQEDKTIRK